jgi:hypothetical protein
LVFRDQLEWQVLMAQLVPKGRMAKLDKEVQQVCQVL